MLGNSEGKSTLDVLNRKAAGRKSIFHRCIKHIVGSNLADGFDCRRQVGAVVAKDWSPSSNLW